MKMIEDVPATNSRGATGANESMALTLRSKPGMGGLPGAGSAGSTGAGVQKGTPSSSLVRRQNVQPIKPQWHAPWKLMRVISGHLGWVRSVAVEPGNQWFCTGAGDRTIKIWDLASGNLRLTLTGHISTVRGLAVSPRHPYLFSCGEDKMVKCWDLESNRVIRHYHGHLSGVYSLTLHPILDVLVTSGRDGVARVRFLGCNIIGKILIHCLGLGYEDAYQCHGSIRTSRYRFGCEVSRCRSTSHYWVYGFYCAIMGSYRRKVYGCPYPSQEECSQLNNPSQRIHVCVRVCSEHQAVEMPGRCIYAEL